MVVVLSVQYSGPSKLRNKSKRKTKLKIIMAIIFTYTSNLKYLTILKVMCQGIQKIYTLDGRDIEKH